MTQNDNGPDTTLPKIECRQCGAPAPSPNQDTTLCEACRAERAADLKMFEAGGATMHYAKTVHYPFEASEDWWYQ